MDTLLKKLQGLECPVNWNLERVNEARDRSPKHRLIEKLGAENNIFEAENDLDFWRFDGSRAWQKCSQLLTLSWLEYPEPSKMSEYLAKMEAFIANSQTRIPLIARYINALEYMINSMWAHVYYKEKNITKVEELGPLVFDELEEKDKSAILALKSCVFMEFGPIAHEAAYSAIDQALELEDDQAEWHFLKGKCMSRTRRARNHRSAPTAKELHHLRKAVEMDRGCASHSVFCGQSIKELAFYSRQARSDSVLQDELLRECVELLTIASHIGQNLPVILTRIAKGLMGLENIYGADLLEQCVNRSVELLPDSGLVNHVAGLHYGYQKRDLKRAFFHLEKAAFEKDVFGAYMNLIDLKWTTSAETVEPIVDSFWVKYKDDSFQRTRALPVMASFHFFVKNDLMKSIEFWKEWMPSRQDYFWNGFFIKWWDLTIPLVGEIQLILKFSSTISTDHEGVLREFLCEVKEARPELIIDQITKTRAEVIQLELNKMDPKVKNVITQKLPFFIPQNHHHPGREAMTAGGSTGRARRELPKDWRRRP